jgi:hypothetical protein
VLLIGSAVRSPAPIQEAAEATPTPKPKREATPRPRFKPEATAKRAPTVNRSFAGEWNGDVAASDSNGNNASYRYAIDISDDEKTVLLKIAAAGQAPTGPPTQFSSSRFRDALTWTSSASSGTTTYTMRINPNGTASLFREGSSTDEDANTTTYTQNGTLSRRGAAPVTASQPSNAAPPTNTPASTDSVPTAKPVPDKPGFVYNPFDPKSKILLRVGNIPSGTKVKDPTSGKIFIVP